MQKSVLSRLEEVRQLKVSTVIAPGDRMVQSGTNGLHHYFYVGRSNLFTVLNVLGIRSNYRGGDTAVRDVLDFGCGHGRVARYFRAAFPDAQIHVTDFDQSGMEFCVENLGCIAIPGPTPAPIPAAAFDLVWLGSVMTHLPAAVAEPLLQQLLASLRPNGVLVFTSQGRYSIQRMKGYDWEKDDRAWMHYKLGRAPFETLVNQYHSTGYGYAGYPGQEDYGVCVAEPSWFSKRILKSDEFIQILFQEKGSDNHQDVSAFMRADLLDSIKGSLWRPAKPVP